MAAHLKEETEITWDILKLAMTQRSQMKACWLYSFSYDCRWKAVMCSVRSLVICQTLLMEIAQRHGPLKVLDGIRALGGIWGINHILIKVWMTPKKTILEGFSYLFSLKKKNLHLRLGQKDYDSWSLLSVSRPPKKSFRMVKTDISNRAFRWTLKIKYDTIILIKSLFIKLKMNTQRTKE